MKQRIKFYLSGFAVAMAFLGYVVSCTHEDVVLPDGSKGPNIERGNEVLGLNDAATSFDKSHSNVNWSTPYLGEVSILTGRFNYFGFRSFHFEESNPDSIYFEAFVYLNTVNTSEPGRDGGCLLTTFGTGKDAQDVDSNLAVIKTKKVEFSTTDKGYIVTADLTFHKVTKTITAKLDFAGKTSETFNGSTFDVYGFNLSFSILAQTDFGIQSTSIADNVDIKCGAAFKHTY
jgi:polyisoprenoid-binding protein YceI